MFTRISNFQAKCYKIYQGEELKLKLKCDCVCGQSLTPSGQVPIVELVYQLLLDIYQYTGSSLFFWLIRYESLFIFQAAPEKTVVILHGCCHNPTGVNPTEEQLKEIGDLVEVLVNDWINLFIIQKVRDSI